MEYFILPFVGGLILFGLIGLLVKAPGRMLAKKFVSLGDMKGKTYDELVKVVGPASSISHTKDEMTLRQWMATGYHIAILFDKDDKVVKITHEASAK